jgi:hypothetical protein
MTKPVGQKRSFLSLRLVSPKPLKNLVPQTRGRTLFGFVTFLAVTRRRDIRAQCSIGQSGLESGGLLSSHSTVDRTNIFADKAGFHRLIFSLRIGKGFLPK